MMVGCYGVSVGANMDMRHKYTHSTAKWKPVVYTDIWYPGIRKPVATIDRKWCPRGLTGKSPGTIRNAESVHRQP
jgi:hypothetical protein